MLKVSMNTQAVAIEARHKRPNMSSFHGFFGLKGFAGAARDVARYQRGATRRRHGVPL
jgi:hypothetical protein